MRQVNMSCFELLRASVPHLRVTLLTSESALSRTVIIIRTMPLPRVSKLLPIVTAKRCVVKNRALINKVDLRLGDESQAVSLGVGQKD